MPAGRPTTYTLEIAEQICAEMAEGELAIDVCSKEGMPKFGTLHGWKGKHPEFAEAYARARVMQAHALAERAVRSGRAATAEDAQAARVKMDADKWLAARLDPKNYGERVDHEISGNLNHHTILAEKPLTEAEWTAANVDKSDAS